MFTDTQDQWFKSSKSFATPLNEWNKTTNEMCQRFTQQQLSLISTHFSRVSEQMKRFTSVKKPEDFMQLQKECLQENIAASIESMQNMLLMTMENLEELSKLCQIQRETVATSSHTKSTEKNK